MGHLENASMKVKCGRRGFILYTYKKNPLQFILSDFCKSLKSGLTKSVVMLKVQESIFVGLFLPRLIAMPSGNLQFCLVEPMWIQEMLAKKKERNAREARTD